MNKEKSSYLVVDLGNTDLKFGFFWPDSSFFGRGWHELSTVVNKNAIDFALISTVSSTENFEDVLHLLPNALKLNDLREFPITNLYKTPETLGQDRLANAIAINQFREGNPALSIDAGTCLKFDFVDDNGCYLGGSISPGLRMRFKAMHDYTAKLPLVVSWEKPDLIGTDTTSSIVSGVIEGMTNEINETIRRYQELYENISIFLTGGDSMYFENAIKYRIFADPNLTLHGLKVILEANV